MRGDARVMIDDAGKCDNATACDFALFKILVRAVDVLSDDEAGGFFDDVMHGNNNLIINQKR